MLEEIEQSLATFGKSWHEVEKKLNTVGMQDYAKAIPNYSYGDGYVLHWVFFAMASLVLKDVKNVLEIGSGAGASTAVIARLFPESTIYTIDVPEFDPKYGKGWRGAERRWGNTPRFKENIARDNIEFIESNSFFLPTLGLPKQFEFIFVDGDHTYPVVASDIMFSYNSLVDGGFLFMHDYEVIPKTTNDVSNTVNWMRERIKERIFFLPQQQANDKMVCLVKGRCLK